MVRVCDIMKKNQIRMPRLDDERLAKSNVIAIMNNKGGCGKTTTAMALGMYYVRMGDNVLFIDNDPQSNLTQRLGLADDQKKEQRLHNIFTNISDPRLIDMSIIIKYPYLQRIPKTEQGVGKIGLIPGSHTSETYASNMEVINRKYPRDFRNKTNCTDIYDLFKTFLNPYCKYYDHLIIDTAPALEGNILNTLAVRIADEIIYPVDGVEAALGIDTILDWMDAESKQIGRTPNGLFAMVKYQVDTKEVRDSSKDRYSRNAVFRVMKEVFQDFVCDTGVKEKRSLRFGKKMLPGFGGRTIYTELCEEIARKISASNRDNLFKFTEENGKRDELQSRLLELSAKIQKRKPKFKQPYYIKA